MARNTGKNKPSLVRGIVIAYLGFNLLVSGSIFTMILGAVLLGLGVFHIVTAVTGGKQDREEKSPTPVPRKKRGTPVHTALVHPEQPVNFADLSRQDKQLEQLKSLYSAGLYTKEEFEKKRREILQNR